MMRKRIVPEPRLGPVTGVVSALALALACGASSGAPVPSSSGLAVREAEVGATSPVGKLVPANGNSYDPVMSADGRFVAFDSTASNLVPGDTNKSSDVFVRDRLTGTTELVSVSSAGTQGNNWSYGPLISPDGRFVAFTSYASNLVAGDKHGYSDVFVRDQLTGTTERVSVSSTGEQGRGTSYCEGISSDGRFVVFASWAPNLVAGDTNRQMDVFVRDRLNGTTERVSLGNGGEQAQGQSDFGSMSDDGRFVAFHSNASNLVAGDTNKTWDVFVRDQLTGTTERVSLSSAGKQGNGRSNSPLLISDDGRFVAFDSTASNLVARDTNDRRDVFVRDRLTGTTERVSVSSAGGQANGPSLLYATSDRLVAFVSKASNLVPGDTNKSWDVFLRDQLRGTTELVSAARTKR